MLSIFINENVNLQEKINNLDEKNQDIRKYLHFCMNYKNELVVEMKILILINPKNNVKKLSKQASTQVSYSTIKIIYPYKYLF